MRPSFLDWADSALYLHDRAHDRPALAEWTAYQRDLLAHLFPGGADPLPYTRIVWSCPKKSAKSTLAAGLHLWFALYIDTPGEQYVLANDLDGSRNRVFRYALRALERNPKLRRGTDWKARRSEIEFANGSIIRAIPADLRGEAGGNQSFTSIDEPWGIIYANGVRLATEFSPVPTRPNSTVVYTGYQGWQQSKWWHDLIDTGLAGEAVPELAHLDNGDGGPACWRNGRLFVYYDHLPRMPWHTPNYLAEQQRVLPPAEYLRLWENRRTESADAFCTPDQWDRLLDSALRSLAPGDRRPLVLGVDAATRSDCTALVGCTWNAVSRKVEVVYVRVWQPGAVAGPVRLTETVGPEIIRLHREYRVAAAFYDPYQMVAIAEMCARAGVPMREFPQTARRIESDTHLHGLIWGGNLAHYGDPTLREHVTGAAVRPGERGLRIIKDPAGGSGVKVDAAVALAMAALGAVETLTTQKYALQIGPNVFYGG